MWVWAGLGLGLGLGLREGRVGPSPETCIDPEFIRNSHHCNNEGDEDDDDDDTNIRR